MIFKLFTFFFINFQERRGISQDVTLDIKVGIEAKNYEGVSNPLLKKFISFNYLYL